jgi:PAS domain S-box-containing protein
MADVLVDPAAVLAALPDPVVVIDDRAQLVWANPAAEEWAGWQVHELAGEALDGLVHPDDMETALASLGSVQEKPVGTAVEVRFRNRAGYYHAFEVRGRAAFDVPGVGGIILALRNTTDRRRWEVAAGDTEMLQAILDHVPVAIVVLEPDGRVRGASRALTAILGRPLEVTLGVDLASLVEAGAADDVQAELARASRGPEPRTFEAPFTRADGGVVPLRVTVVNLLDDQTVRGLVATAVEVHVTTERRVLDAIAEGVATVGDLATLAAHAHVSLSEAGAAVDHLRLRGDIARLVDDPTRWALTEAGRAALRR